MAKAYTIDDLNKFFSEAETADADLFAEQRSNLLLVEGTHYQKKNSRFWARIRDSENLTQEQKLRITKNHIQRICKQVVNYIVSQAPGVSMKPAQESELSDQKAAQLHQSVWNHIKTKHRLKEKVRQWAEDYVVFGEAWVKIGWDHSAGELIGYQPEVDPMTGMPVVDPMTGQVARTDTPIYSGDFTFERLSAFNVLRAPEAKAISDSPYLIYRKMVPIADLKEMVGEDSDKLKFINESADETFTVFDTNQGTYRTAKDQVMVREYYFRPCRRYPRGYYYYTTSAGVIFEGELPFGLWPILHVGFDEIQTNPRSKSLIKVLRPFQAELNRAASQQATQQVLLGDDKILIQEGTKLTHGGALPGVRAIKFSGMTPQVLPGRGGEQFTQYIAQTTQEMYAAANLEYLEADIQGQTDAYTLLFRSIRQKKKYAVPGEKFEQFLIDVANLTLRLAKAYMPEQTVIRAVGRNEIVNLAEFKHADDFGYQVTIEASSEDPESKVGRAMMMQQILQYVGTSLSKDDIGRMIRTMPYFNTEQASSDLTINYDNATNDILSLDRGEYRPASEHEDHAYMLKRLIHRMKQADFQFLPQGSQMLYARKVKEHEVIIADQQRKMIAAKADLIPSGGYMVTCDIYLPDPMDPSKTKRARIPYEALNWLIKRLEDQGSSIKELSGLPQSSVLSIAAQAGAGQQQPQQAPGGVIGTPPQSSPQLMMNQQAAGRI